METNTQQLAATLVATYCFFPNITSMDFSM